MCLEGELGVVDECFFSFDKDNAFRSFIWRKEDSLLCKCIISSWFISVENFDILFEFVNWFDWWEVNECWTDNWWLNSFDLCNWLYSKFGLISIWECEEDELFNWNDS